jgi:IclR family transcriptional regulator, pca regulon regulatory protein
MTTTPAYTIDALVRGIQVLALFTQDSPMLTQAEIVERTGFNKSMVFRILSTLEALGYLERHPDTKRYRPSLKVLQLGFTALNSMEVRQVAKLHLERLAQLTDETASLAVLDGLHIVYIDRMRNRAIVGVLLGVGSRVPAHSTSLGKVLLADLPTEELTALLAQTKLDAFTPHTIVDQAALLYELATIRTQGYAVSDEELALGLRGVSAPIRDHTQNAVAAINVSGPSRTLNMERLEQHIKPAVIDTAYQISLALGYVPTRNK